MTTIEYCDLCATNGIKRPAYAIIKFRSVGAWFAVCRQEFDEVHGQLGEGRGKLVNVDAVPE
jgi:hypothetical protein